MIALLGALLAVVSLAAACSGGSAKTSASTTTTVPAGAAGFAAARARLTQCLESHGVPANVASSGLGFGGRRGGGSSTTSSTTGPVPATTRPTIPAQYQAAFQACRGQFGGAGANLNSPALAAYRNCLQVHGVTLPSTPSGTGAPNGAAPDGAGTTNGSAPPGGFGAAANDPTVQAARQACASLLPARSSTTTTSAP